MTAKREVREDQHGTVTGYTYGCRCSACTAANRIYGRDYDRRNPGRNHVSEEVLTSVLAELAKNADLDDEVTVSATDIASALGISQPTASSAIRALIASGQVDDINRIVYGIHHLRLVTEEAA